MEANDPVAPTAAPVSIPPDADGESASPVTTDPLPTEVTPNAAETVQDATGATSGVQETNRTARPWHPSDDNPNLYKPGQSGNPHGRPKGTVGLTARLRAALDDDHLAGQSLPKGVKSVRELIIAGLIKAAAKGNAQCLALMWDRLEGKQTTPIAVDVTKLSDEDLLARARELIGDGSTP